MSTLEFANRDLFRVNFLYKHNRYRVLVKPYTTKLIYIYTGHFIQLLRKMQFYTHKKNFLIATTHIYSFRTNNNMSNDHRITSTYSRHSDISWVGCVARHCTSTVLVLHQWTVASHAAGLYAILWVDCAATTCPIYTLKHNKAISNDTVSRRITYII